jgi:putative membrane protein
MHETVTPIDSQEKTADRSLRDYVGIMLRGVCMGASDIVPGVSGGTMAFILGIYEELIDSIRAVGQPPFLQALFRLRIKEIFDILNWKFLLAVASGILLAIFTLSQGLEWLLITHPIVIWSFFFGLVLASVYVVSKRIDTWTPGLIMLLVLGTLGAYLLVGLVPVQTPETWWYLILSGALAICAMILPGISGAFILVLLGKYQFILSAVNQRDIVSIALVGIGAVIGLVTFAQILGWLFKRYYNMMVALLTGLMLGSLRRVWPWKMDAAWLQDGAGMYILDSHGERIVTQQINMLPDFSSSAGVTEFVIAVLLFSLVLGAILLLERLAGDKLQTT